MINLATLMAITLKHCVICSADTKKVLDLGIQPLANNYHNNPLKKPHYYPLQLYYCPTCFHSQISSFIETEQYCQQLVNLSTKTIDTIVDCINNYSSNTIVKVFDPTKCMDLYRRKLKESVQVLQSPDCGSHIYDIIIAGNMLSHTVQPLSYLRGLENSCHHNTIIFVMTQSSRNIVGGEFDLINGCTLSYFSVNSMNNLCRRVGMCINEVDIENDGKEYIFTLSKTPTVSSVTDIVYDELVMGLYSDEHYENLKYTSLVFKNSFHNLILLYRSKEYKIIGYGSTARSNTLLNYCNIDSTIIDFIVDDDPAQINMLAPGSNIPIKAFSTIHGIEDPQKTLLVIFDHTNIESVMCKLKTIGQKFNNLNVMTSKILYPIHIDMPI